MKLNEKQLKAIRYYEGDVKGEDPFWGDPKAYVTLNSLFYDGIDTETRRAMEGKRLNPAILEDTDRLYELLKDLLDVFDLCQQKEDILSYRVERYSDYLEMKKEGRTISFTSTSSDGFLKAYGDRIGIALMEFHIAKGFPCICFSEVLEQDYLKADEKEILLPPNLKLNFAEVPLSEDEKEIRDANGDLPILKCIATVEGICTSAEETAVVQEEGRQAGIRVYQALNHNRKPEKEDVLLYAEWKKTFRNRLFRKREYGI